MHRNLAVLAVIFLAGTLLSSCSNSAAPTGADTSASSTDPMKEPKSSLSHQFDLIKAGDAEKLKACFTPRLRDRITQEAVDKAKVDAAKYTMDDLYASAEMGTSEGHKTAKIQMKNGRTLTMLVETDGQWLADTIWFK